jgi:hypothetical protein
MNQGLVMELFLTLRMRRRSEDTTISVREVRNAASG